MLNVQDAPSLLKRYGKDLRESPNRRTDKWKSITNMLWSENAEFISLFLSSDVLDAVIISVSLYFQRCLHSINEWCRHYQDL